MACPLEELLPDLRNYLDITWEDSALDRKLWEMATAGMAYLDRKIGEPQDYTIPGPARSLLLDYVRYMRDGAMDLFENNYRHLILAAQSERQVWAYAKAVANEANGGNQPKL